MKTAFRKSLALATVGALTLANSAQAAVPAYVADLTDGITDGSTGAVTILSALAGVVVLFIVYRIIKRAASK